ARLLEAYLRRLSFSKPVGIGPPVRKAPILSDGSEIVVPRTRSLSLFLRAGPAPLRSGLLCGTSSFPAGGGRRFLRGGFCFLRRLRGLRRPGGVRRSGGRLPRGLSGSLGRSMGEGRGVLLLELVCLRFPVASGETAGELRLGGVRCLRELFSDDV